jgi:molecular chaperone GrpE (heat shock protein)
LCNALASFRDLAAGVEQQDALTLTPLLQDLQRVSEEIDGLLADRTNNRVRLNLSFEYSTLSSSRQTITQGIAAGLESEISKFANVEDFFKRRIANLATRAAAETADLADSRLDPERRNKALQGAVDEVFIASEVESIAPAVHEEYRATDHAVVQSAPGTGRSRPNTIAQLLTRGLRYQGRVVRKANVVLFN